MGMKRRECGVRWIGYSRGACGRRFVQQGEPGKIDVQSTIQVRGMRLLMNV